MSLSMKPQSPLEDQYDSIEFFVKRASCIFSILLKRFQFTKWTRIKGKLVE